MKSEERSDIYGTEPEPSSPFGPEWEVSYEQYEQAWYNTQGLTFEELEEIANDDCMFSVDLTEATYRIPYKVIDEQNKFIGEVLSDFKPWSVFQELYTSNPREVDMSELISKGYWNGPEKVTSTRGTFMGDSMSFIHLTLLLSGITRSIYAIKKSKRPIGQSVGDDMLLLQTDLRSCLRFCLQAERLGCQFSKLNSISEDTATFCENYVAKVSDLNNFADLAAFKDSIFGDLLFLDIIKGSALSGQSKVSADGGDPFIGHANLLGKQVKWHPLTSVKTCSKVFLWARNYNSAHKLASSMASLPIPLGGLELAVGPTILYSDSEFQKGKLPWYEGILDLPERDFLEYYLLLRGVYQANPKGIPWMNSVQTIHEITKSCELFHEPDVMAMLPDWLHDKGMREKLSFIEKELRMVSFHHLISEIARQDSFAAQWNGKQPNSYMTLLSKDSRTRSNQVWGAIKSKVVPKDPSAYKSNSMKTLATLFESKTWGLWVPRDSPAIRSAFGGMPSLFYEV
jgi:hypothetical protein